MTKHLLGLALAIVAAAGISGCLREEVVFGKACAQDADCGEAHVCFDGACVPRGSPLLDAGGPPVDAGAGNDAGRDDGGPGEDAGGPDAGLPVDGGPPRDGGLPQDGGPGADGGPGPLPACTALGAVCDPSLPADPDKVCSTALSPPVCVQRCRPFGGDECTAAERCVPEGRVDGGASLFGGCVPGVGAGASAAACAVDADCQAFAVCRDEGGGARCVPMCDVRQPSGVAGGCVRDATCTLVEGKVYGTCGLCDALSPLPRCATGQWCRVSVDGNPGVCRPSGGLREGEPCDPSAADAGASCGERLECAITYATFERQTCQPVCDYGEGAQASCGGVCEPALVFEEGTGFADLAAYGSCFPSCSYDQPACGGFTCAAEELASVRSFFGLPPRGDFCIDITTIPIGDPCAAPLQQGLLCDGLATCLPAPTSGTVVCTKACRLNVAPFGGHPDCDAFAQCVPDPNAPDGGVGVCR